MDDIKQDINSAIKIGRAMFANEIESEINCSNNVHNNGDGTEPCPKCNNYGRNE